MGNIIINALTKAERLARYKAMPNVGSATEVVTNLVNGTDDVAKQAQRLARKAKYNSQFQSTPNIDLFVKESTPTVQVDRAKFFTIPSHVATPNIAQVKLDPKEIAFFSENLKGAKHADIEQVVSEILALKNINGMTGFTRKLGHKSAYSTRALLEAKFNDSQRYEEIFVPDINKTPIDYMSDTPLYLSKQQLERELATIGNGRTFVTGGGGNYSLGTGDSHWCSVYDYRNGNIRFANPNATADYKDVPISTFIDDYLGVGVFHNH